MHQRLRREGRRFRRDGEPGYACPRRQQPAVALWATGVLVLTGVAAAFVLATGMRPAYDAYGWLDWGRQAAHLRLDTNAAPSWKPLSFLFTFPYALLFAGNALWAWMVTAVASAFAVPLLAGSAAFRLSLAGRASPGARPARERRAAMVAAVLAAGAAVGIAGWWHFVLIATADPMMVGLTLGALDALLAGRLRLAWTLLILLCLGRPEALPVLVALAAWAGRSAALPRRWLLAGILLIPLLWFGIPVMTADSWLISGEVLGESTHALSGSRPLAVLNGFASLYELPMQVGVLAAAILALILRLRAWLLVLAAAGAWLAVDIALALHGWGIAPRYMFEPAALAIVLPAATLGRLLSSRRSAVRAAAVVAGTCLVVTLAPSARVRGRLAHNGILLGRTWARQIHRLHELIRREGGRRRILSCGQAVTTVPYQSILAWELHENVIDVGWDPATWRGLGLPIVVFQPVAAGWSVRVEHGLFSPAALTCSSLPANTPVS